MVGALEAGDAGPVVTGGRRYARPGQRDESGLVVGVVLDVLDQDLEPIEAGRQPGGDGRGRPGCHGRIPLAQPVWPPPPSSWWPGLHRGEPSGEEPPALCGGHGNGGHPLDLGQGGPRRGHQVEVDVEDHLPLDPQVEVEDQAVDDVPDGALDGVLQWHESEVDPTLLHRLEDLDERAEGQDLGRGVVGLTEERLFGEGTFGPEEPDSRRWPGRSVR